MTETGSVLTKLPDGLEEDLLGLLAVLQQVVRDGFKFVDLFGISNSNSKDGELLFLPRPGQHLHRLRL